MNLKGYGGGCGGLSGNPLTGLSLPRPASLENVAAGLKSKGVGILPDVSRLRPVASLDRILWRSSIEIFREAIALTVGALLPIMNPFSTAPLFIALTAGMSRETRNRQALLACIYAFGILIAFLLLGSAIIDFFRISIPGLRTAGGLIVSTIGFRMLFPSPTAGAETQRTPQETEIAFTPIAMPSLAGPGSITVVLTAAPQLRSVHPDDRSLVYFAVVVGMIVTLILCLLVLRAAGAMVRFLGHSGIDAMTRIFGFLLICIGMQFLLTGIGDFYDIG